MVLTITLGAVAPAGEVITFSCSDVLAQLPTASTVTVHRDDRPDSVARVFVISFSLQMHFAINSLQVSSGKQA